MEATSIFGERRACLSTEGKREQVVRPWFRNKMNRVIVLLAIAFSWILDVLMNDPLTDFYFEKHPSMTLKTPLQ